MASRLSGAWLTRAAAAVVASAVSLLGATAAQAAIAGGNPSTSGIHPDIRTATILDPSDVQVCFDKPISQSSTVFTSYDYMWLVGYNTDSNQVAPIGATLDAKNNQCVDLAFNTHSGSLDLGQFTAVVAELGAVQTSASGGQTNWADSTTLLNSTTHNGTAGLTSAPDLVGPAPVAVSTDTPNDIAFVFDQSVDPAFIVPQDFWYENANGQFCYAQSTGPIGVSGTTVIVQFPMLPTGVSGGGTNCADTIDGNGTSSVTNARRAGVDAGAVRSVSSDEVSNWQQGTNMPSAANAGATNIASLVSAALGPENGQVTYTFDHPVNAAVTNVNDFFVTLSDGTTVQGCSGCSTPDTASGGSNATQVVITYARYGLQYFDEYAVQAGVTRGAVVATNGSRGTDATVGSYPGYGTNISNTPGAAPIGGNAGAFARGFTTGPDMYAVQFDSTHDVATADFDQRIWGTDWAPPTSSSQYNIQFLDANGNDLGGPTSVVIPSFPNPGPVAISMDVDPAILAQHPTQIALNAVGHTEPFCAFWTVLGPAFDNADACSIPQIVSVTGAGAHVRSIRVSVRMHKVHRTHRSHRSHRSVHRA